MGHKDNSGKTFGPGHDGWYAVVPILKTMIVYRKAKSSYSAAQLAGYNLTQARTIPITTPKLVAELEATGTLTDGYTPEYE